MIIHPIRILVADDHPIFRDGVRRLLDAEPGFQVVGEAATGEETLALVRDLRPDVLLLDLMLGGISGLDVLRRLEHREEGSMMRVIIVTASIEKNEAIQALMLGARGIVRKQAPPQMLFRSIHAVMANELWISREVVPEMIHALKTVSSGPARQKAQDLTPREREIIRAVAEGQVNKDIAGTFKISEHTVKHHLTRIFDKLAVSNRVELARFAVNHGLVKDVEAAADKDRSGSPPSS